MHSNSSSFHEWSTFIKCWVSFPGARANITAKPQGSICLLYKILPFGFVEQIWKAMIHVSWLSVYLLTWYNVTEWWFVSFYTCYNNCSLSQFSIPFAAQATGLRVQAKTDQCNKIEVRYISRAGIDYTSSNIELHGWENWIIVPCGLAAFTAAIYHCAPSMKSPCRYNRKWYRPAWSFLHRLMIIIRGFI